MRSGLIPTQAGSLAVSAPRATCPLPSPGHVVLSGFMPFRRQSYKASNKNKF